MGGSSTVKNENGEDIFFVKGRIMSHTRVKYVCDKEGNRLFKVRNRWFNFFGHKAYIYDEDNNKIARVKNPYMSVKKFIVEDYKDDIEINGDFFSPLSTITKNGQQIGTIIRQFDSSISQFFFGKDFFCLEADEADIPFLVALVIAIDNIVDHKTGTFS